MFHRLQDGLQAREDVTLRRHPAVPDADDRLHRRRAAPRSRWPRTSAAQGVCVWAGHYYALELMQALGLPDGAVRAGIACYTTPDDVDRLLEAL